ncbi:uncharacterized protein AB675_2128 [Cyphellophora attinorum]|uniref:Uncharacterized protein n=1 Tax=Cyphellophora attinorum TaxID=1664694 RepID=A0A0N1HXS9_9EURO|nr:uncharacterized protein AB675_2128 [Phialophora attinorum]KPI42903.1 hypothetical protein AB675_2128 [Phialophora attinorum]
MASKLTDLAHTLTQKTSSAVHGVHGIGEVTRGTINSTLDGLVPNKESKEGGGRARNDEIAAKGLSEMRGAEEHLHGGGYAGGGDKVGEGAGNWGAHSGTHGGGAATSRYSGGESTVGGTDVSYVTPAKGEGAHLGHAGVGSGAGPARSEYPGSAANDTLRQEREQERLWEAERREREAGLQQQDVPGGFPGNDAGAHSHQPQQQTASNIPPSSNPPISPTMRNHNTSNSNHHGLGSWLHHHKPAERGEGSFLSQGSVRTSPETQPPVSQQQTAASGGAKGGRDVGAEAARLAWNSGRS